MSETNSQPKQFTWAIWTLVACIAIIISLGILRWRLDAVISEHMSDFSAMHATHDAIRLHTERTGEWPTSWDDLKPHVRELYVDDLDWVRERVEVDFSLTSEDLDANPQATIIRLRSGWGTSELPELNRLLRERLTKSSHQ